MSVNLELYNFFCSIVEYGSFSEASKKLYISQPAITQKIHNLEVQLDRKLFYRTAKGVILTEQGETLYQKVRNPVKELKNIEYEKEKPSNQLQEIKIAVTENLFEINFLYHIIIQFYREYPNIKVSVNQTNNQQDVNSLLDTNIQFLLTSTSKKIRRKNIREEDTLTLHPCFYTLNNNQKKNEKINLNHTNNNLWILPRKGTVERRMLDEIIKENQLIIEHYYEADYPEMKNILLNKEEGIYFGFKENILDELQNGKLVEIKTDIKVKDYLLTIIENNTKKIGEIPNFLWNNTKAI